MMVTVMAVAYFAMVVLDNGSKMRVMARISDGQEGIWSARFQVLCYSRWDNGSFDKASGKGERDGRQEKGFTAHIRVGARRLKNWGNSLESGY